MAHPLNPQGLAPGETCAENFPGGEGWIEAYYYLGFACGVSAWRRGLSWSEKDRERARTQGCGLCAHCEDEENND